MKEKAGFLVKENQISFKKSNKLLVNNDWDISLEDIVGIALGNTLRMDDDSSFIILLLKDTKPIFINITYQSEEMDGFEDFWNLIKNRFGLDKRLIDLWSKDNVIMIYPKKLEGKSLYKPWNQSFMTLLHEVQKKIGLKHSISGVIREEFKEFLQ